MGYNFCTWDSSISDLVCYDTWENDQFDFEPEDVIDAYDFVGEFYAFFEDCQNSSGTWTCVAGLAPPMIQGGEHTIVIEIDGLQEDSEYYLNVETYRDSHAFNNAWDWEERFSISSTGAAIALLLRMFLLMKAVLE